MFSILNVSHPVCQLISMLCHLLLNIAAFHSLHKISVIVTTLQGGWRNDQHRCPDLHQSRALSGRPDSQLRISDNSCTTCTNSWRSTDAQSLPEFVHRAELECLSPRRTGPLPTDITRSSTRTPISPMTATTCLQAIHCGDLKAARTRSFRLTISQRQHPARDLRMGCICTLHQGRAQRGQVLPLCRSAGRRDRQFGWGGQRISWHFDTNNYTVTLALQNGSAEAHSNIVPTCAHRPTRITKAYARYWTATGNVRTLQLQPATCNCSRGVIRCTGSHRWRGSLRRYVAIFSFVEEPGMVGRPERVRQLYGRVLPIHLEREGQRADGLVD